MIDHPVLTPGNLCPGCEKGKVYELAFSLCPYYRQRSFELPADVSGKKYDDSAAVMIALLKYGCGLRFHRIERLQSNPWINVSSSVKEQYPDNIRKGIFTTAIVSKSGNRHAGENLGEVLKNRKTGLAPALQHV